MSRARNRQPSTIALLHGEERFLVDESARAILDGWRAELVSAFGFETLDGAGLAPARVQDAVLQAPFLDPYRVVFVRSLPANPPESPAPPPAQTPPTTHRLLTPTGRT